MDARRLGIVVDVAASWACAIHSQPVAWFGSPSWSCSWLRFAPPTAGLAKRACQEEEEVCWPDNKLACKTTTTTTTACIKSRRHRSNESFQVWSTPGHARLGVELGSLIWWVNFVDRCLILIQCIDPIRPLELFWRLATEFLCNARPALRIVSKRKRKRKYNYNYKVDIDRVIWTVQQLAYILWTQLI